MIQNSVFISACLEEIYLRGLDELSAASICTHAGVSRPSFYSKFENVEGLLAETWLDRSNDFFAELSGDFFSPSKHFIAMSKILALTHRSEDVATVTRAQTGNWWGQARERSALESWKIANRLGFAISSPALVFPEGFHTLDKTIVELSRAALQETAFEPSHNVLDSPPPGSALHESAIRAICHWGYKGASMARIARHLRITSGSIYPNHRGIKQLLEESFALYQRQITSANVATWGAYFASPTDFGTYIRGGLAPERKVWRHLRLETMISAQSHPRIATRAGEAIHSMASAMEPILTSQGADKGISEHISYFFHTLGVGFGVLSDLGIPLHHLNHEDAAKSVADVLLSGASG